MKPILQIVLLLVIAICGSAQTKQFYFTTSDSVRLFVKVAGNGTPCVFIHGGPGSNSYYYEAVRSADFIEKVNTMIYFDQRGCGRSEIATNGDYSLARMEKDIEELRLYLGFKKWAVIGHSFGGIIATKYAYDFPNSLTQLLLIHATLNIANSFEAYWTFGKTELAKEGVQLDSILYWPLFERFGRVHFLMEQKGLSYKSMYRNNFEKELNDTLDNPIGTQSRVFANKVWSIPEYFGDFVPLTNGIRCPVLIMSGKRDYAIGPDHYKLFQFPYSKIVLYEGGHAPFQEEPQWYAEKILRFLNGDK